MATKPRFYCVSCRLDFSQPGRYDPPVCPRCGCRSSLFPEWLWARRAAN